MILFFGNEAKIKDFGRKDFEKPLRITLQNNFFNFDGKITLQNNFFNFDGKITLQNNFFNFDGKIYKQTDGVVMSLPLGPSLANAFLCLHEEISFSDCPEDFKPVYYRRYVDDIFALFCSPDHL